jgi:hypothetical protein
MSDGNDPPPDYATIYFSIPFEHGCGAVHITNIRNVISRDDQGNPKVTSLWKNSDGQPAERWVTPQNSSLFRSRNISTENFRPELGENLVCFDYIAYGK